MEARTALVHVFGSYRDIAMLIVRLVHALPIAERRVFNRNEAASYVGVSPGFFDKLVSEGRMPRPLPMGRVRRWDKAAIDVALDALGDLNGSRPIAPPSPYDAWSRRRGQG